MKLPKIGSRPLGLSRAFTLAELLIAIVVVGILLTMFIPSIKRGPEFSPMTGTLANARSLQLATSMMALDTTSSGADGMDWTMWSSKGKTKSVSLETYFEALTKNNYLPPRELHRLLSPPKVSFWTNPFKKPTIAFQFFQFDSSAPSDQPFVVTANWQDRHLTVAAPYGKKGFVYFTKGGDGGLKTRPSDPASPTLFPTGSKDGHAYSSVILQ